VHFILTHVEVAASGPSVVARAPRTKPWYRPAATFQWW